MSAASVSGSSLGLPSGYVAEQAWLVSRSSSAAWGDAGERFASQPAMDWAGVLPFVRQRVAVTHGRTLGVPLDAVTDLMYYHRSGACSTAQSTGVVVGRLRGAVRIQDCQPRPGAGCVTGRGDWPDVLPPQRCSTA